MGLLDGLAGQAISALTGSGENKQSMLLNTVMGMLTNQTGGQSGLAGLVEQFASKGLGDIVNSWVGTGANKPITSQQIQQGLGADQINQLAQKAGVSPDVVSSHLAELLPKVVDKLTPTGQVPQGDIKAQAMSLLQNMLK
jgi:uncharacterized protein YidB (DUF937 family)